MGGAYPALNAKMGSYLEDGCGLCSRLATIFFMGNAPRAIIASNEDQRG